MTIADRIQNLRKTKGISQKELADNIGVSRQAVSKWESEQSTPDVEKIILLSEYFEVTTDYLLKGVEPVGQKEKKSDITFICNTVATALNLLGIVMSVFIWYSTQETGAVIAGLVFVILGTMVHVIGLGQSSGKQKISTIYRFWEINVWTVIFIPLALVYNVIMEGIPAPYPMININTIYAFAVFWLVYFLIGGEVMSICRKSEKEQRHED